ncbi:MAG TPA: RpiB/LacA/LacB family sugar-phosphate isomerase [Bacillota bacterium]|nr:RpiB/LacA/LacB family sugar-phosphate isomerase [Bacillota bacterium]
MKIAIGADSSGFELKEKIREYLEEKEIEYKDFGTLDMAEPVEYYNIAPAVARGIQKGEYDYGLLFCGTGMGMAQIANSFKGIRAAVCESLYSAILSRSINDSNILTMGGFLVAANTGIKMTEAFLDTELTDGLPEIKEFLVGAQVQIKEFEELLYQ